MQSYLGITQVAEVRGHRPVAAAGTGRGSEAAAGGEASRQISHPNGNGEVRRSMKKALLGIGPVAAAIAAALLVLKGPVSSASL
jgi:hypothetical protein